MKSFYLFPLKAFVLFLLIIQDLCANAQATKNYDLGVFYMPYWYYPGTDPMNGNWSLINDYDTFLITKGESNKARIPMNNYWPSPVWYDEKMASVTEKQLELMKSNQLDFVVFDSYWNYDSNCDCYYASYNQVLENLMEPGFNFHGMNFGIMWANDFTKMVSDAGCERFLRGGQYGGLDAMISYWAQFINHPRYKKIDGKPVFYIYYPSTTGQTFDRFNSPGAIAATNTIEGICTFCADDPFFAPMGADANEAYGSYISHKKTKFLLDKIEEKLGQQLYFVAVITPDIQLATDPVGHDWSIKYQWLLQHPEIGGYDAVTSYGYKYFDRDDAFSSTATTLCNGDISFHNWGYDYSKMQQVYNEFYGYMINNSNVNYQVPVSAGWNQGPLNKYNKEHGMDAGYADSCNNFSRDPLDQALSTPSSFEQSLINARSVASANSTKTKDIIMISAWNEYGEGKVIEPTITWGFQYLQKIKDIFTPIEICCLISSIDSQNNLFPSLANTDEVFNVFPNPASRDYNINFRLFKPGNVRISLYNKEGKLTRIVTQENMKAGLHDKSDSVNGLHPGIYYLILEADGKRQTKKVVVEAK